MQQGQQFFLVIQHRSGRKQEQVRSLFAEIAHFQEQLSLRRGCLFRGHYFVRFIDDDDVEIRQPAREHVMEINFDARQIESVL